MGNTLFNISYGLATFFDYDYKKDLFEVHTSREGNDVLVYNKYYFARVPMKDTVWMVLSGTTWESKVAHHQKKAFQVAYETVMREERLNYQVERLK